MKYYLEEKGVRSIDRICKRHIICLVAIIALAGTIRFWNLNSLPLIGDEAYHYLASSAIHKHGIPIMDSGLVYTRGYPLLYLQAISTATFGDNVMALRLPSAIIGILSVFLTFIFFKAKFPSSSLLITLLVAISPLTVHYSRNARMYELLMVSSLALWIVAGTWRRTGSLRYLIGTLLLIVFIIPVHKLSIIPLLGIVIPSILNDRFLLTARIYLVGLFLVSLATWFGYYYWLRKIIFPSPEHLVFSKQSLLIYPDFTLPQQVFNSSPIISSLILALGLLLVGAVICRYKEALSNFDRIILFVITGFAALHFSMVSVCGTVVWALVNIYRNDKKQGNLIQIFLAGFGITVFTLLWVMLATFYSDMSLLAIISRCLAYPKIFENIILASVKAGHLLELMLLGYTIFLLLFFCKKFSREIHLPSLAGLSIFIISVFIIIGITSSLYKHIRYFYYLYPLVIGLGIIALQQLKPRVLSSVAIILLILFFAYGGWKELNLKVGDKSKYNYGRIADYDSVSRRLMELRRPGDIVISTSSHRTAPFGGRQDGFFAVELREYQEGKNHYITNAVILRTPKDLIDLTSNARGTIWMIVRLLPNLPDWTKEMFSPEAPFNEVFRSSDGEVYLYSATRKDIINALFRFDRHSS